MGTDISCFAERRTEQGWELCEGLEFYRGEERNYALFAILAGVKRLTNAGFDSISPPRGLPPDLSPGLGGRADFTDGGFYHNASWLTLKELQEFPWHEKQRAFTGWVDAEQYQVFRKAGRPDHFV